MIVIDAVTLCFNFQADTARTTIRIVCDDKKELVCFSQLRAPVFEEGDIANKLGDTEGMSAATKIVAER